MEKIKDSAWSVWLHPRKALKVIQDQNVALSSHSLENKDLKEQLETVTKQLKEQRLENARLSTENITLAEKLKRCEDSVLYLGKEVVQLRKQLQEFEKAEQEIDKFQLQLQQVEDMKAGYELRIKRLKENLRDLREAMLAMSGAGESGAVPSKIDMTENAHSVSDDSANVQSGSEEEDWLSALPPF